MSTTVFAVRSVDGNLELALCPGAIELRLTSKAARDFDAACEAQKSATWLPIWRQIKTGLVSAAQRVSHKFADKLRSVPLEAVTGVTCTEGRLQVQTAEGNQIKGQLKMEIGSYKLEYQLDAPGIFPAADASAFARRFAEVKPLYDAYLANVQKGAKRPAARQAPGSAPGAVTVLRVAREMK